MTKGKECKYGDDARAQLMLGIEAVAKATRVTLGPKGRNVIIEQSYGAPRVTKDGVTVAKSIDLSDPAQNLGAQLIKSAASKAADVSGDGTTTATVLTASMIKFGQRLTAAGMNPVEIKRGIEKAVGILVDGIAKMSEPVGNEQQIMQVATISANNDKVIGSEIAKAMEKVGKNGVITVEEAKGINSEVTVVEGMQFDRGYISPYFVTNQEKMIAEFDNPYILVYDKKISSIQSMLSILEQVAQSGRSLLIIAEDVDSEALATLIVNRLRGGLRVAAVKAPGFGDRRKAMLEDISILSGARMISEDLGIKIENTKLNDLGTARKVTISKDFTTIIDGAGNKSDIEDRCAQIKKHIEDSTSDYDKEKLQERLAKLSGGVAIIRVGGATEAEVKEKKDRVDDALSATKAAIEEGIVPGGGVALVRLSKLLKDDIGSSEAEQAGVKLVRESVRAPFLQILENAGENAAVILSQVEANDDVNYGYDAAAAEYVDMKKRGVIDPAKVVRTALQSASSIATLILTTDGIVYSEQKPSGGGRGGMPGGMPQDMGDY